jgi:hypothetical protein
MGDHLIYEDAVSTELYTTSEFVSKQYLYVNDNNNGSYSSQIVLDTTSLSNSGFYIGWSEAFILMPLVIQMEAPAGATALSTTACYDWVAGMKNGYWQMIHAMTVEFNNRNVVQQVPFLNVFSSFKAMTSWSYSDVSNWGAICGFYPDTADSWIYNNIAQNPANQTVNLLNTSGTGISNNRNCAYVELNTFLSLQLIADVSVVSSGALPSAYNLNTKCTTPNNTVRQIFNCGLQKRQSWINFDSATTATGQPNQPQYGSLANPGTLAFTNGATNTAAGIVGSFTISSVSGNQGLLLSTSTPTGSANPVNAWGTLFQANISSLNNLACRVIQIPAVIRLKDICNFFEKLPLLKGSTMRIYLNTNQCQFQAQYINGQLTQANAVPGTPVGPPIAYGVPATILQTSYGGLSLTSSPYILGGGATNPIMLASNDLGQGGYNLNPLTLADRSPVANANPIAATAQLVNFAISIAKCQFTSSFPISSGASCPITQCRLYAPAFAMNPLAETRFLELTPTKKILYNDIFQFYFPNQAVGANINILVSNGIPNIKNVIVIPLLTSTGASPNGVNDPSQVYTSITTSANTATAVGVQPIISSTLLSPFATTGATPDPIPLGNFQILISGTNLFIQPLQYNFEDFYEQLVSINQLNGSLTTGLGSGLIGYKEWQYLYRYYVGNASRIIPSEEGMARSVQIQCQNLANVPIDLMVFVEYEKSITINMATGQEIA